MQVFDQNVKDLGEMSLKKAYELAENAGCNLFFTETEEDLPVAIFTTKNQSRELGQYTLKPKLERKSSAPKVAHQSNRLEHSDRTDKPDPQEKKTPSDKPKFTLVSDDPD